MTCRSCGRELTTNRHCEECQYEKRKGGVAEPSAADKFHDHLDQCQQCESRPFSLCSVGARLLAAVPSDARTRHPGPSRL